MTRKKEKLNTEEITTEVIETLEVQTLVEEPKKEPKPETKKEPKPEPKKEVKSISDLEVARKLVNIHSSAQSRNLEFNLTFEYVKKLLEYNTCYYTNVQFTEDGPNQRTFDRVDNEKGYIVGNVVACTSDINGKKNNLTIEDIICLYKKLGHLKK
jgi:hypothetical protein